MILCLILKKNYNTFFQGLQLRLVNGPSRGIGRVEIMRNKIWGTLCEKGMTEQLATEICKMAATTALSWYV